MKELLKQIGISICFIALFVGLQIGVQYAMGYGYVLYSQLSGWQMSPEELSAASNEFLAANTELFLLISGCLTILMVWLFSMIRKRKFVQDCNLVPFNVKNLLPIVLMTIGCSLSILGVFSFLPETVMNSYDKHMGGNLEGIVVMFLSTAVVAPIVEELIFRGVIMPRLNRVMNIVPASILTTVAFGLLHMNIVQIIYSMILGLILCFIAVRCTSLLASCFFHILFNTIGSLHFMGDFLGDSIMANAIVSIIGLVIVIATIIWVYKINEVRSIDKRDILLE